MFQLNDFEADQLVSQNVIPHKKYFGGSLPYAFTEHFEMKQKVGNMPRINEAMDTDSCLILAEPAPYLIRGTSLKWVERLQYLGWKRGDTLLYHQGYAFNQDRKGFF